MDLVIQNESHMNDLLALLIEVTGTVDSTRDSAKQVHNALRDLKMEQDLEKRKVIMSKAKKMAWKMSA